MQKRTREILALVLLAVLMVVGASAAGYYILVGHNWNVTASHIDDRIGQMNGYTVILFEGTRPPYLEGQEGAKENAPSEAGDGTHGFEEPHGTPNTDVRDIVESYRAKEATVFSVDASDLSRYAEPFVVSKNGKKLGFLAVANAELRSEVRRDIAVLRESNPDYIIAVTDDGALPMLCYDGTIEGISVIVGDSMQADFPSGDYSGPTYCARTPQLGDVGAVVISPSGVFSTKTATAES